ncbi:MAG: anaerobic glycerol-3-phosphate dehydrogenase subunit A [Caldilineales bacterium]|nr:anaerobic glycerol-3-phosphate dehydrogenase subunit A [Caldilineales bacterium]MCW5859633.1 anaerobic glycerol-3-phosphate dehydrogenase subunit A [Caldilineales bacterium]
MKRIETEILVVGGGATGTGVAWDAALRGFQVVLVEKRDLTHGTTGRYHGLLHSGGRYVVKDPVSATECIHENRILRRTHTHCIEDTGGFFVVTPEDEGEYPDKFLEGCVKTGVDCAEISVAEALRREPLLNRRLSRVFEVPDGSADSFLATHATAQAARLAGARILNYHELVDLIIVPDDGGRRVVGARVRDVARGEEIEIRSQMVINATGAWANKVTGLARITISVVPGKGTMVAMSHRLTNTVLNRCKKPSDGDIIVPVHTVAVIGTTDERVTDPENLRIEPWEVQLMLDEGERLIPGISQARVVRAWAGVRPLYQEDYAGASREATRQFALLDHKARHNVAGFLTITGGKWTTFRLMAEKTVDKACEQLGARKACVTAQSTVPGAEQGHYWLGHRLHEIEDAHLQGQLVCECELVTRPMLEAAARNNPTLTLDDLRRDVRLGMGPCQGGWCTYRSVGIIHELGQAGAWSGEAGEQTSEAANWDVAYVQSPKRQTGPTSILRQAAGALPVLFNPNLLLRDFLQERWKGVTPILWGQQLKQERLDEMIYLSLLNVDHLPESDLSSPLTDFYHYDTTPNDKLEAPK